MTDKKEQKYSSFPTVEQLEAELSREKYKIRYRKMLKSTVYTLIIVAAIAVLIATLAFPVLQISGSSMEPTLNDDEIVVLLRTDELKSGDLCCFSYQNKYLIKRVIGTPGDVINIDSQGNVYLNGKLLDEPYVVEKSLGECDLTFPYQVSENHYFVLGDHRSTSVDSRSSVIGLIADDQIVGKIFFRIWPFEKISIIK